VQGCAVSLHEDPVAGPCLAACVVAAAPVRAAELRRFLQERLPEFMIPAHFTFVAELPLTPSGKIDRARLPSPAPSREPVRNEPHEGVESEIASVLKEVLRLESVGRDESFLDLGLHSILMARAHGELQRRLGREFPLIDMLQHGSVASLAGYLTGGSPAADSLAVGRSRAAIRLAFRRRQSAGGLT
jgi:acyl carrier protein